MLLGGPQAACPVLRRRSSHPTHARLFHWLDPYEPPGRTWAEQAAYLEELADSLIETRAEGRDPELDHPTLAAGYACLAEFVEHELTREDVGREATARGPGEAPRLDLASIYGRGPEQSYLYDESDGARLLVDRPRGAAGDIDLPRNRQGRALIGEPRNDRSLIMSQLHLALMLFHNAAVTWVAGRSGPGRATFEEARRLARWHYQWVVLHDLLPRLVGRDLSLSLLARSEEAPTARMAVYGPEPRAMVPLEFSLGAFLARHSLLRSSDELNDDPRGRSPLRSAATPRWDLRGGRVLPDGCGVQWDRLVSIDGSVPKRCRRLNTMLPSWVHVLPPELGGGSMVARNLARAWHCGLPSGQDVARALGLVPVRPGSDPLWVYVLSEAEDPPNDGLQLVGVGARIVAEVLVGVIATDPESFLSREPAWQPVFGSRGRDFDLAELLRFARVPLSADGLGSRRPRLGGATVRRLYPGGETAMVERI